MKAWKVVRFTHDNTIEAVPLEWINDNDECFWSPPTYNRNQLTSALRNCEEPDEEWILYDVVHFENNTFDSNNEVDNESETDLDQTITNKKRKSVFEELRSSHTSTPTSSRSSTDMLEMNASTIAPTPACTSVGSGCNNSSKCLCCPVHSEVQACINQLAKDIQGIKKQNEFTDVNQQKSQSIFIMLDLPATSKENLSCLEDYLNNGENFERAVLELQLIGGGTLYDFVKRMLSRLITNELAAQFSFFGLRTKEKFSQLKVPELIN
ncbi:hypothetical protein FQR65_LT18155 [Abscondita terminalis]|nr:hypothetical protein FQR65_LT18155 [Abscondita terminalis]